MITRVGLNTIFVLELLYFNFLLLYFSSSSINFSLLHLTKILDYIFQKKKIDNMLEDLIHIVYISPCDMQNFF